MSRHQDKVELAPVQPAQGVKGAHGSHHEQPVNSAAI
jgi:hypothetical protein